MDAGPRQLALRLLVAQFAPVPKDAGAFISYLRVVVSRGKLSTSAVVVAALHIRRFIAVAPFLPEPGCEVRLALTALLLASKFVDDNPPSNHTWAKCAGAFSLPEINRMELEFLVVCHFDLRIDSGHFFDLYNPLHGHSEKPPRPAPAHTNSVLDFLRASKVRSVPETITATTDDGEAAAGARGRRVHVSVASFSVDGELATGVLQLDDLAARARRGPRRPPAPLPHRCLVHVFQGRVYCTAGGLHPDCTTLSQADASPPASPASAVGSKRSWAESERSPSDEGGSAVVPVWGPDRLSRWHGLECDPKRHVPDFFSNIRVGHVDRPIFPF